MQAKPSMVFCHGIWAALVLGEDIARLNYLMMRLAKPIFLAVLAVALAAYAFDCGTATMLYDRDGILRKKIVGFEYTNVIESELKPLL